MVSGEFHKVQGDVGVITSRLLPKISDLYNSPNFSDVQFVYGNTGDSKKIFGHKLILAIRSKFFSQLFYEREKVVSKVEISSRIDKELFEKLLKYLYTDNVHFHSLEETYDLLNLAQKYGVQDLIDRCNKFILDVKLTVDNLFPKYDYALKNNLKVLLDQCRTLVCSKTNVILQSKGFLKASSEVIQDIVKLQNLSIFSELEIIMAVLNWVKEDMKNKNLPFDKKLSRKAISPFLNNLRFLTLTQTEFDYFVENYDILSGREISVLTRKMLQPDGNDNLPDDICPIILKRRNNALSRSSSALDYEAVPNTKNKALSRNSSVLDLEESAENQLVSKIKMCSLVCKNETKMNSSERINKISSPKSNQNKFSSSADIPNKVLLPTPPTYSFTRGSLRSYSIPLNEFSDTRTSSYPGDLTSCVRFEMLSGKLLLYGFELKIRNRSKAPEKLEVFMYLEGFSKQPLKETFQRDLCNNVLTVQFPKPMTLQEGSKGSLEVAIETINFNRLYTCDTEKSLCELNNGLNFSVKLSLESQKKTQGGFYFTIDKLLYKI